MFILQLDSHIIWVELTAILLWILISYNHMCQ